MSFTSIWQPVGTQSTLLAMPYEEILFAGPKGSGMTQGAFGHWLQHATNYGAAAHGIYIRSDYGGAANSYWEAKPVFLPTGATFTGSDMVWSFPNGATLKVRGIEDTADTLLFSAHTFSWMCFEHAEEWPSFDIMMAMRAYLRSCVIPSAKCQMLLTADTDKAAGTWIDRRYIGDTTGGWDTAVARSDPATMTARVYIPARLTVGEPAPKPKREIDYSEITKALVG